MSLPDTQLAVVISLNARELKRLPVVPPVKGEILVKNVAVASNPKDYKVPLILPNYASVEGNDIAGVVAAVGEDVKNFKVGDRVAALTRWFTRDDKNGAYAEYSIAPAYSSFHIPSNISFEDASTIPLALMTACINLYKGLKVPDLPQTGTLPHNGEAFIVYGASSSVGAYVVQLVKRNGFYVVGVAGGSAEYAKELGCDVVVDYRQDDLVSALLKAIGSHPCSLAFDCISAKSSVVTLANVLSKTTPTGSGKVRALSKIREEDAAKAPQGIELTALAGADTLNTDFTYLSQFYNKSAKWFEDGSLKPNRVRIVPGGLASVEQGLKELQEGKVHGEKLVYRIAETPEITGN